MKFGLFGGGRVGKTNPLGDSYAYQDFINYIVDAEQVGFEGVFLVEHHFTGHGQLSAAINLLSYLAAKTSRIRLGTGVVVLPWHNPVLVAEQIAMLDLLSGGRVDLGVGRGYRKEEFDHFCVPIGEAQERFAECFEVMLKCWKNEDRWSHHGKRWNFKDIVVEPSPVQRPHPPVWMAGGTAPGISYIASQNYNLLVDQLASIAEVRERVRIYLDNLEKAGQPRTAARVAVSRAIHVVHTEAEREKALERRRDTVKKIGALARHNVAPAPVSFDQADIAQDDAPLIGSPDEIVERLLQLAQAGVEYVLLTSASATRKSLEEFADKILPHVRDVKPPLQADVPQRALA